MVISGRFSASDLASLLSLSFTGSLIPRGVYTIQASTKMQGANLSHLRKKVLRREAKCQRGRHESDAEPWLLITFRSLIRARAKNHGIESNRSSLRRALGVFLEYKYLLDQQLLLSFKVGLVTHAGIISTSQETANPCGGRGWRASIRQDSHTCVGHHPLTLYASLSPNQMIR